MASSGSTSGARGNPVQAMAKWARHTLDFCRSLMDFGLNTENNKAALSSVPMDDHNQVFQVVSEYVRRSVTHGTFRWTHADTAADVLAQGNLV